MKISKAFASIMATAIMSTMTTAFAGNAVEISRSEVFAQSFIANYYASKYLDKTFDDSSIKYDELSEYIKSKINYMQYVSSDVENFGIQMELLSKKESANMVYLAYFVEAEYKYVDLDTASGFGECVQIVVDKSLEQEVCDFFVYDSWDSTLRDANSICADSIVWENEQSAMQLVQNIQERITDSIYAIEKQMVCENTTEIPLYNGNYSLNSVSSANRTKIVNYALTNCNKSTPASGNPDLVSEYYDFSSISGAYDCTNFSSHCLLAGGAAFQKAANRGGWYYQGTAPADRSMSWSSVSYFYDFVTQNTGTGPKANELTLRYNCPSTYINYNVGDFIQVSYYNNSTFDHTLVITDIKGTTSTSLYPYVTGRSGYSSGLEKWYVKNEKITKSYGGYGYRVLAFTSLT